MTLEKNPSKTSHTLNLLQDIQLGVVTMTDRLRTKFDEAEDDNSFETKSTP